MTTGQRTSCYLPHRLLPLVRKPDCALAAGITAVLGRYEALLAKTMRRMEMEYADLIPKLAEIAPWEEWRAKGIRRAALDLAQDSGAFGPEIIQRLESLTMMEAFALAELIERKGAEQ